MIKRYPYTHIHCLVSVWKCVGHLITQANESDQIGQFGDLRVYSLSYVVYVYTVYVLMYIYLSNRDIFFWFEKFSKLENFWLLWKRDISFFWVQNSRKIDGAFRQISTDPHFRPTKQNYEIFLKKDYLDEI